MGLVVVLTHMLITYSAWATTNSTIKVEPSECQFFKVDSGEPLVRDLDGEAIRQTVKGSQVTLENTVKTTCKITDSWFIALFEVRNADSGLTYYLLWQDNTISYGQTKVIASSWIASEPGNYVLRFFLISQETLNNPQPISSVKSYEFKVIEG
jgi:hypothetical protein